VARFADREEALATFERFLNLDESFRRCACKERRDFAYAATTKIPIGGTPGIWGTAIYVPYASTRKKLFVVDFAAEELVQMPNPLEVSACSWEHYQVIFRNDWITSGTP
jgi:hypothetical protein